MISPPVDSRIAFGRQLRHLRWLLSPAALIQARLTPQLELFSRKVEMAILSIMQCHSATSDPQCTIWENLPGLSATNDCLASQIPEIAREILGLDLSTTSPKMQGRR